MRRIINYFYQNPDIVPSVSILLVVLIGIIDYATGYEYGFSMYYFIPVIMAGWFVSLQAVALLLFVCLLVWTLADVLTQIGPISPLKIFLNVTIRSFFFMFMTYLLFLLKDRFRQEEEMAQRDFLTGIANSRYFFELATRELQRAERTKEIFSIAYADIDNFKEVNDISGHQAGDRLLQTVASTIVTSVRKIDVVARFGGDEFVLLMPATNSEQVRVVIERVSQRLIQAMGSQRVAATLSIGVATFLTPPPTVDRMIGAADSQMYEAKKSGKNQIQYAVIP